MHIMVKFSIIAAVFALISCTSEFDDLKKYSDLQPRYCKWENRYYAIPSEVSEEFCLDKEGEIVYEINEILDKSSSSHEEETISSSSSFEEETPSSSSLEEELPSSSSFEEELPSSSSSETGIQCCKYEIGGQQLYTQISEFFTEEACNDDYDGEIEYLESCEEE